MVSIIVPVYNAEKFLAKTIECLLNQKIEKEIILVDDGSTDDSQAVIKKYASKYSEIKPVTKCNGGVSSARNLGIKNAIGDYIVFVDSDDQLEENSLECALGKFDGAVDCVLYSYDIIINNIHNPVSINKKDGLYSTFDFFQQADEVFGSCILNCIGSKIYKTSIIRDNNILFDESTSYCEDIGYAISYLKHTRNLYFINRPYYLYYMINDNSLMTQYKPLFYKSREALHIIEYGFLQNLYGEQLDLSLFNRHIIQDVITTIRNESNNPNKAEIKKNLEKIRNSKFVLEALATMKFPSSINAILCKCLFYNYLSIIRLILTL